MPEPQGVCVQRSSGLLRQGAISSVYLSCFVAFDTTMPAFAMRALLYLRLAGLARSYPKDSAYKIKQNPGGHR